MVNNDILALIEEEKMAKGGIKGGLQDTSDLNEEISSSVDKEGKQKRYTCTYNNKQKAKKQCKKRGFWQSYFDAEVSGQTIQVEY